MSKFLKYNRQDAFLQLIELLLIYLVLDHYLTNCAIFQSLNMNSYRYQS